MLELYDDRVKQVEPNTGAVIEEALVKCKTIIARLAGKTREEIDAFLDGIPTEG